VGTCPTPLRLQCAWPLRSTAEHTRCHAHPCNGCRTEASPCVRSCRWCTHRERAAVVNHRCARESQPTQTDPVGLGFCCFVCNGQVFCLRAGAGHSRCSCIGYSCIHCTVCRSCICCSCIHGMPQLHPLRSRGVLVLPQMCGLAPAPRRKPGPVSTDAHMVSPGADVAHASKTSSDTKDGSHSCSMLLFVCSA
jgi:hypothetical protein